MDPKAKAVFERIDHIEDAIVKAHEYLESGKHADWHGFRPLLAGKMRDVRIPLKSDTDSD